MSVDITLFNSAGWTVSSYSGGSGGGSCVEVADAHFAVAVRDTKDRDGGVVIIPGVSWRQFVAAVKRGHIR